MSEHPWLPGRVPRAGAAPDGSRMVVDPNTGEVTYAAPPSPARAARLAARDVAGDERQAAEHARYAEWARQGAALCRQALAAPPAPAERHEPALF